MYFLKRKIDTNNALNFNAETSLSKNIQYKIVSIFYGVLLNALKMQSEVLEHQSRRE